MTGVTGRTTSTATAVVDIAGLICPVDALIPTEMTTARSSVFTSAWPPRSAGRTVTDESLVDPAERAEDRRTAPSLGVAAGAFAHSDADRYAPDARRSGGR